MGYYQQQEFDFIERTKKILKQYDSMKCPPKEKYEITLLINCITGLLILPQQHWFANLPETMINRKEWGIPPEQISFIKIGEKKNVKNVSRHLRNAISHYHFTAFSNSRKEISSLKFLDFDKQKEKTFEATISIHSLRHFLNYFSDYLLEKMKN